MFFKTRNLLLALLFTLVVVLAFPAVVQARAVLASQSEPFELPKLTVDLLMTLTGSILSVVCYLIPPVQRWLSTKLGEWTPLFMAGVLLAVAVGYQFVACMWLWACLLLNWQAVLMVWIGAVGTNFAAYKAIVKPAKAKAAEAAMVRRFMFPR
jgi:hypothetical protein